VEIKERNCQNSQNDHHDWISIFKSNLDKRTSTTAHVVKQTVSSARNLSGLINEITELVPVQKHIFKNK
jgi:hypothetical protein